MLWKLLSVIYCVDLWVWYSVFSIFCINDNNNNNNYYYYYYYYYYYFYYYYYYYLSVLYSVLLHHLVTHLSATPSQYSFLQSNYSLFVVTFPPF